MQIAMLSVYPRENPVGKGIKYALWDLPAYHKLYYQPFMQETLKAGDTRNFRMVIKGISAVPDMWKDVVKNAALEYK
jgi:hypothetical protein